MQPIMMDAGTRDMISAVEEGVSCSNPDSKDPIHQWTYGRTMIPTLGWEDELLKASFKNERQ